MVKSKNTEVQAKGIRRKASFLNILLFYTLLPLVLEK
jgi:hypothetical protein